MQNNEDIIIDHATDSTDSAVHTHTLPDGTTFSHRHDEEGFYASAEPGSTDDALTDHTHSHHGHSYALRSSVRIEQYRKDHSERSHRTLYD